VSGQPRRPKIPEPVGERKVFNVAVIDKVYKIKL
jgi:hypothetical protein